jgi:hypothetical protein
MKASSGSSSSTLPENVGRPYLDVDKMFEFLAKEIAEVVLKAF